MNGVVITTLLCLLLASAPSLAEETNYCHDAAVEAQWTELIEKSPADMDLQALHALRLGLCMKVDRGDLSVEQATKVFERARSRLLEIRRHGKRNMRDDLL